MEYAEFLASKRLVVAPIGFEVAPEQINPLLFPFQRDIVRWALRLGRAALFANVGLGKTAMQLEWARHVADHTGAPVLILTPLAVAPQTVREGEKFGIAVRPALGQGDVDRALATEPTRIFITNYDRAHLFDATRFSGIVLDESSILKHYSTTFFGLTEQFQGVPANLRATAHTYGPPAVLISCRTAREAEAVAAFVRQARGDIAALLAEAGEPVEPAQIVMELT
jgi:hypothetical protein